MAMTMERNKELEDIQYYSQQVQERRTRLAALERERQEVEAEADRYNQLVEMLHKVVNPETALWTPAVHDDDGASADEAADAALLAPVTSAAPQAPLASHKPQWWKAKFGSLNQPTCLTIIAAELGGELDLDEATKILTDSKKLQMQGKQARTRVAWILANDKAWEPTPYKSSPFSPVPDTTAGDGRYQRYKLVRSLA